MPQWWLIQRSKEGLRLLDLYKLALDIIDWSMLHMVSILARFIPGKKDTLQPAKLIRSGCPNIIVPSFLGVWRHLLGVWSSSCQYVHNTNECEVSFYISPISNPMAWKQDDVQHSWDNKSVYSFPPLALFWQALPTVMLSVPLHGPSHSIVATERLVPRSCGSSGGRTFQAAHALESVSSDS